METQIKDEFSQLCVWPSTLIEKNEIEEFVEFIQENFGVRIKFSEQVFTNPDLDDFGDPVPETGGRSDLFFYVHAEDTHKFAVSRLKAGIRWWEDVVGNENHTIYPQEIIDKYPTTW